MSYGPRIYPVYRYMVAYTYYFGSDMHIGRSFLTRMSKINTEYDVTSIENMLTERPGNHRMGCVFDVVLLDEWTTESPFDYTEEGW